MNHSEPGLSFAIRDQIKVSVPVQPILRSIAARTATMIEALAVSSPALGVPRRFSPDDARKLLSDGSPKSQPSLRTSGKLSRVPRRLVASSTSVTSVAGSRVAQLARVAAVFAAASAGSVAGAVSSDATGESESVDSKAQPMTTHNLRLTDTKSHYWSDQVRSTPHQGL